MRWLEISKQLLLKDFLITCKGDGDDIMIQFSQAQLSSAKEASNFRKTYYINYSLWTRKVLRHVTIVYQYISQKFILNDFWNKEYSYIESGISTTVKHSRSHKPPFDWLSVMWILIVSTLIVGGSPLYFEHNLEGKKNWHSRGPFSMFVIKNHKVLTIQYL